MAIFHGEIYIDSAINFQDSIYVWTLNIFSTGCPLWGKAIFRERFLETEKNDTSWVCSGDLGKAPNFAKTSRTGAPLQTLPVFAKVWKSVGLVHGRVFANKLASVHSLSPNFFRSGEGAAHLTPPGVSPQ